MSRTDRRTRITVTMASLLWMVVVSGLHSYAGDAGSAIAARQHLPFTLTRNSLLTGAYVFVGDLSVEGKSAVDLSAASPPADREELRRCIEAGPNWLRWSADGTTIEMTSPWGSTAEDKVLTTYCGDGFILLGGYRQTTPGDDPSQREAWLFEMIDALQSSPARIVFTAPKAVGPWARQTRYTLNEVRSIDPDSKHILFAGVSEDGVRALLSAPFALDARSKE